MDFTSGYICPSIIPRHQVSPIHALEVPESLVVPNAPLSPPIDDVVQPVPPLEDEVVTTVELEEFGGGHVKFSLLSLYPNHTTRHIWDREVKLLGFIMFKLH